MARRPGGQPRPRQREPFREGGQGSTRRSGDVVEHQLAALDQGRGHEAIAELGVDGLDKAIQHRLDFEHSGDLMAHFLEQVQLLSAPLRLAQVARDRTRVVGAAVCFH